MNKCYGVALFLLTILFTACSDSDDKCSGSGSLSLVYDWSASKSVKPNVNLTVTSENGNVSSLVTDNVGSRLDLPLG